MSNFYFSRLTISSDVKLDDLDKANLLLLGISDETSITYRKDDFKFIAPEVVKSGSKLFVTGYLVKYKETYNDRQIKGKTAVEDVEIKDKVLAEVRFIIDPESSIIIHQEDRGHIPKESFGQRFSDLFKKNIDVNVLVSSITEKYDFSTRIKEIKEIKRVSITLVPSNPNNSDLWKDIDERLSKDNISQYKETQVNNKKGEGIIIDDQTEAKFLMSQDGYGQSDVSGKDATGKTIRITTNDASAHTFKDIDVDIKDVNYQIQELRPTLENLINRTKERET